MPAGQILESSYSEALFRCAKDTFAQMLRMKPTAVHPADPLEEVVCGDVVGVLGFTGTRSGVCVLSTTARLARAVGASMLFQDEANLSEAMLTDAFGEIVNMVLGGFKNTWVEDGNSMALSVPSVSVGRELHVRFCRNVEIGYSLQLDFEQGPLRIDLRFHE